MDLVWLFPYVGLSMGVGAIAVNRGRSFPGWWGLAIVLSPVLAIILLLLMRDLRAEEEEAERRHREHMRALERGEARGLGGPRTPTAPIITRTKKCPDCAEEVLADARVCRFCRHAFEGEDPGAGPGDEIPVNGESAGQPVLPEQMAFGLWSLRRPLPNLPGGTQVDLSVKRKTLTLKAPDFLLSVLLPNAREIRIANGNLLIVTPHYEAELAALQGQSTDDTATALQHLAVERGGAG